MKPGEPCPCGSGALYGACCAPCHAGERSAPTAEALMRSRYAAYVLQLADYLLATWHVSTRPQTLDLSADPCKWLGLEVRTHRLTGECQAEVEFVARYRVAGRGHRLHELSRFVLEDSRWFYVDGDY